jgi:hypothetical protein
VAAEAEWDLPIGEIAHAVLFKENEENQKGGPNRQSIIGRSLSLTIYRSGYITPQSAKSCDS